MTTALDGGGDPGKANEVRELSKRGCVKMGQGGRRRERSKVFVDVINGRPLIMYINLSKFASLCFQTYVIRSEMASLSARNTTTPTPISRHQSH